jgi:uncharacterized membrane protein YfcA
MAGLPLATALACLAVVYLGAVMQATTGVGVGMIASPVLALADPAFIPACVVLAVIPLSATVAWADRHHVDRPGVGFAILGRIPGVVVGAAVAAAMTDEALAVLVGGSVLLGVAVSITSKRFSPTRTAITAAGFASGFTGTSTGVGGPPMALTYQHIDATVMRATISAFFTVGAIMSAIALTAAGEIGRRQLELAALIAPAIVAGLVTARLAKERLTGPLIRPVLLGVSTFAAAALLVETFA